MGQRVLWIGGLVVATLLVVLGLSLEGRPSASPRSTEGIVTGSIGLPVGLMVARSYTLTAQVDVVRWDGSAWQTQIPASAIQAITHGSAVLEPVAVLAMYPNSVGTKIALWIMYCSAVQVGETEHCAAFGSVYSVAGQSHSLISTEERTGPIGWIDSQQLLVYNVDWEFAFKLDTDTNSETELQLPIDVIEYSSGIPAIDSYGSRVLVSTADADGVLTIDSGLAVWFAGGPPSHTSTWMSFSPDDDWAVVSRIRAGAANTMGAGQLKIFSTQSGALLFDVTPSGWMDSSPVWSADSAELLFLRQNADSFATAVNPDSLRSFSSVQSYDTSTGTTTQVVPADRPRKGLFVVGSPNVISYIATVGDRNAAFYVADSSGTEVELSPDGLNHTAVSWSE